MRKIIISDYDRQWPDLFEAESKLLQETLGAIILHVHHIGSTAVPGLAAKPIIDILLEVASLNELDKHNAAMEHIGYAVRGENGICDRRYFTKGGDRRSHHVHAFIMGDPQILKHLAFRDYLILNTEVANRYAGIKRAAALASRNNGHQYSKLKAEFIENHLKEAAMLVKARKAVLDSGD